MLLIPLIRHIFQKRPLLLYATSVLKRILILILPIIVLSLILVMSGVNIFESASELKERYQGEAGIIETTLNDARFRLGALAIKNIAKEGAVFGRGFGASSIDKRLWGFSELGEMDPDLPPSRVILEVGQIWPLTRGGTVFLIIFNGMLLSIIFSRSKYKNSYFSLACWACILVFFVFSFGEFFLGRPFYSYTILLGACIGYLLSVNRFKENDIGGRLLIKGQPGK